MNNSVYRELLHQYRDGCVFCHPEPRLTAHTNGTFNICYDVAPVVPGHLIIYSRGHYGCAGELPPEDFGALEDARSLAASVLRSVYGSVIFYEHGRAGHCLSEGPEHRLCHHFHQHCLPVDLNLVPELERRFEHRTVGSCAELPQIFEEYGDYLYFEDSKGSKSVFIVDQPIEKHLLRSLAARAIEFPDRADWRRFENGDILLSGMTALATALPVSAATPEFLESGAK